MSTSTIAGYTAVVAGNLTDAALLEVEDSNGDSRKATVAQLRAQLNTESHKWVAPSTGGDENTIARHHKAVQGIGNNSATAILTITVPNADHGARVSVKITGALGSGGAVGSEEAVGTISYDIAIARKTGVNAAAGISTAYGSATAAVAGATTITVTAALSAVSGAVGAVNTFTVNVTIARGGGSSDNHRCVIQAEVHNIKGTGVTLS